MALIVEILSPFMGSLPPVFLDQFLLRGNVLRTVAILHRCETAGDKHRTGWPIAFTRLEGELHRLARGVAPPDHDEAPVRRRDAGVDEALERRAGVIGALPGARRIAGRNEGNHPLTHDRIRELSA